MSLLRTLAAMKIAE